MDRPPSRPEGTAPPRERSRFRPALWAPAAALVLVALCLRGPFSALGPVLDELKSELTASTTALATLTALPLICFGLVSPVAPALARRIGVHRAIVAAAAVMAVGVAVRLGGLGGLFAGTVLLTGGIAVVNVLLPAVARAEYGPRSPTVVGLTIAAVSASAGAGAGLAQPMTTMGGSAQAGLALWLAPILLALLALAVLALVRRRQPAPPPERPRARTGLLRDRVALAVTLFFGLQALSFYAMLTWLADVLESDAGVSPVTAGALVAAGAGLGAPASLVVPALAARRPSQAGWVLAASASTAAGIVGLLVAPAAAPAVWALLYGLGTGIAFPLAMIMVLKRTHDVAQTGRLSAAAQSVGYLLAATGPLVVGILEEATGGWRTGLLLLLGVLVLQTAVGLAAARPRLVSDNA